MIGLDTNVLVRFLVDDDKKQSARAARLVDQVIAREDAIFLTDVVLCEAVWVLLSAYKLSRGAVGALLGDLFRASHLRFQNVDTLVRALESFKAGRGDFADYLIQEQAGAAGCGQVATFDRALLQEAGFIAP